MALQYPDPFEHAHPPRNSALKVPRGIFPVDYKLTGRGHPMAEVTSHSHTQASYRGDSPMGNLHVFDCGLAGKRSLCPKGGEAGLADGLQAKWVPLALAVTVTGRTFVFLPPRGTFGKRGLRENHSMAPGDKPE